MTMGQRIAEERKKLGVSQEGLGEKLEVSRQAVSKWESDGAVPDVDKLIAMSKLFGVSVGWLLGVEEESDPAKEEGELTEKQLRMIEEIVKRYQPEQTVVTQTVVKKESRWFKLLTVAGIAAAVILAVTALNKIQALPNYGNQLNSISNNYNNVQSQLGALSGQLEELAQGARLLTEYECTASAIKELAAVEVSFRATPRQWQEGDTGILVARLDGQEVAQAACSFSGSSCTAVLELQPADGYSYCFVQVHADGSREQQLLEDVDYYCRNAARGVQIDGNIEINWSETKNHDLEFDFCHGHLAPPPLMAAPKDLTWESAQLIFYKNGEELKRYDLILQENVYLEPTLSGPYLDTAFWIDGFVTALAEEDRVSAVVQAKLSNGMTLDQEVAAWYREGDLITQEVAVD